jgi:TrkA domain protein
MDIKEIDLPGVGKKFVVHTNAGERLTLIIHNTGHREIYNFKRGEDFPFYALRLDDDEARKFSALLGGAYFQPTVAGSVDMILEQMSIEWLKVEAQSKLAGKTIAELGVRKKTGASIIAILRDGVAVPNPQADTRLEAGDTLVVVGSREQVSAFLAFARGEQG